MNTQRFFRRSLTVAIASGLVGAVMPAFAGNTVTGTHAVVSGGDGNTASGNYSAVVGGEFNTAGGSWSTVGGGVENSATAESSTVSGGTGNYASALWATVGGGTNIGAYAQGSTIAGGVNNTAYGLNSTVPGGTQNQAGGDNSFAAGNGAHVRNATEIGGSNTTGDLGTFIWGDSSTVVENLSGPACPGYPGVLTCTQVATPQLVSTGPNQFLVRANGGLAINGTPVNANVSMTIESTASNPNYANIFLQQSNSDNGILVTSGDAATGAHNTANNASFYVDQFNGTGHTRRLSLDGSGNLTVTAQAYKPGGGSWAASSDGRLKNNVKPLDGALDRLLALRGVTFEYAHPDGAMHPAGTFTGFIAQEVAPNFPNWIGHDDKGFLTVGPQGFEALTVEALRTLKNTDDKRMTKLETENESLRAELAQQSKQLALQSQELARQSKLEGDVAELHRQLTAVYASMDTHAAVVAVSARQDK